MSTPNVSSVNDLNDPLLSDVWIAVGVPGFAGAEKARRQQLLNERFGTDGWRYGHYVRGEIVPPSIAIARQEPSSSRLLARSASREMPARAAATASLASTPSISATKAIRRRFRISTPGG